MTADEVRVETLAAEKRIREHIRETPLEPSAWLSQAGGSEVFLKLENLQISSSFKFRGAVNSVLALDEPARERTGQDPRNADPSTRD